MLCSIFEHYRIFMDPKQTIKNLERRSKSVDIVESINGVPKPTWVELSLIDVCNRKCVFCPKHDEDIAPDTYQLMTRAIVDKYAVSLIEIDFNGTILYAVMESHFYIKTLIIL